MSEVYRSSATIFSNNCRSSRPAGALQPGQREGTYAAESAKIHDLSFGRKRLQLSEVLNGSHHLAGVAVLVVVPGHDLNNRRYVIFSPFSSVFRVFFSYRYSSRNVRCRTSFLQFLWTNRTRFLIDIFVSANESVSAICGSIKNSKLKFVYVILKAFYQLHTFSPICRTLA